MGCDIHLVLERKIEGAWHCVWEATSVRPRMGSYAHIPYSSEPVAAVINQFPTVGDRNYRFFAALAGVRGDGPRAKGVPDDVGIVTQAAIERWGADGHSHSWDTLHDFCYKWQDSQYNDPTEHAKAVLDDEKLDDPVQYLFGISSDKGDPRTEYRVVYFFDN